jgi:predicted transcriptional regulator
LAYCFDFHDPSHAIGYRKIKCKEQIDSILIYSTAPVMKVVAEVEVTGIIEDTPQNVWKQTACAAGVDKYYQGKTNAVAYALGSITRYGEPLSLSDFGVKFAPQSFVYMHI